MANNKNVVLKQNKTCGIIYLDTSCTSIFNKNILCGFI